MNISALEEIKAKALPMLQQAHIQKAVLFGSYVRGDNTPESDIDILVAFPDNATLIDVVRLKRNLEQELQKTVDLVSYRGMYRLLRDEMLHYQYPVL